MTGQHVWAVWLSPPFHLANAIAGHTNVQVAMFDTHEQREQFLRSPGTIPVSVERATQLLSGPYPSQA